MNARERAIAASRGREVDRAPVLGWPAAANQDPDVFVVQSPQQVAPTRQLGETLVLVEVVNPFGKSLQRSLDLNAELRRDPEEGAKILDGLVEEARADIQAALEAGADGVLYRLHGACARHCSPMQYGGHYLERDRELLEEVAGATLNVLFVVGDDDVYLDFVSDIPAHVFGWDSEGTGIAAAEVRAMRTGAQASADSQSEFRLTTPPASIAGSLEKENVATSL